MPAIVPIVAGAIGTYFGGQVVGAIVAAAASAAISAREKKRTERQARGAYNASLRDQMITVKGGVNPRPIVYGRAALGGQLIYAESYGAVKEHLVLVIALAHGEVDAIETVYFNDIALTIDGSNNVTTAPYYISGGENVLQAATVPGSPYQVALAFAPVGGLYIQDGVNGWGSGDGGAPAVLTAGTDYTVSGSTVTFAAALAGHPVQIGYEKSVSYSYASIWRYTGAPGQDLSTVMLALGAPSWTSADKCEGMAALIVRLTFAENVWPNGVPNIKAVIRGRKVFDPRSSTTAWTANAALCARDYLTFQYGVNAAAAKIDDTGATNGAANICDEDVQLTATPTWQDRYTVNGVISTGDDRLSNLEQFAQAMAGSINYSQGKWRIRAGAYTVPALTLDESRLSDAGDISIIPYTSRRELINGAKGVYVNADKGYIEDQFPEWSSAAFITEDGGAALTTTLTLPLVTDVSRAQRLAKITVNRAREALTMACTCNFSTYAWQVGDMVGVTLARYGFSAKPFRIVERGFSIEGGMRFVLREEPSGLYDWNLGEASILSGAGNTTLPNPGTVAAPVITGISSAGYLYKAGDGTMVARILVSVTSPADQYVRRGGRLQLAYKRGDWSQADWVIIEADGAASAIWIDPAFDAQNYVIRVRAINSAGYTSAWTPAQVHTCIGRLGAVENLLKNSNWAEDLGQPYAYYPDARALRHWLLFATTSTPNVIRNYDNGKTWNVGGGGMSLYDPANVAGKYIYIYQDVPVVAGVAYEVSVYAALHRCTGQIYVDWLDAAKTTVLAAHADLRDAGTAILGYAYEPLKNPRLWLTATAPASAAFARVYMIQGTTPQSSPYPFSAWSNALMCVAPAGVTRATATPWVPNGVSTVDGQLVSVGATEWSFAGITVFAAATLRQFNFTPLGKGLVNAIITGSFRGVRLGSPDFLGRTRYWLRITQGGVTLGETQKQELPLYDSVITFTWYSLAAHSLTVPAAANTQVEVRLMVDPDPADSGFGGNGYVMYAYNGKIDVSFDRKD